MTTSANALVRRTLTGMVAFAAVITAGTAITPPAHAQVDGLYGAGATLPAQLLRAYLDCIATDVVGEPNDPPPFAINCNFLTDDNVQFLYAAVGSGNGRTAFINDTSPTAAVGPDEPPVGSALYPAYPYPNLQYAFSESPLSTSDLNTYRNGPGFPAGSPSTQAKNGPAIQFPFAATTVTIGVNNTGFNLFASVPTGGTIALRLTLADYCGIWTGQITNWNDARFRTLNRGNQISANLPIVRVVRSDSSGTTQLFASRLREQCATTAFPWPATFGTGGLVNWTSNGSPAVLTGNGNGGVAEVVAGAGTYANGAGRVGYLSPSFVEPFTDNDVFPAALQTRNPAGFYAPPTIGSLIAAVSGVVAPSFAGSPAPATLPENWGRLQGVPGDGITDDIEYPATNQAYPISGFSFALLYTCYAPGSVTANSVNRFDGIYRFANVFSDPAAGFDNLWRNRGFVRPSGALKDAIRTLTLIDARTRIRSGTRAPTATFVGCNTGA